MTIFFGWIRARGGKSETEKMSKALLQKNILFVVPRFHTNLFFATRALVRVGARVSVLACYAANGEDHSIIQPHVLGYFPDQSIVNAALSNLSPDLIFLRPSSSLSARVSRWARRNNIRTFYYNQKPINQRRSPWRLMRLAVSGYPLERVTPCRGLEEEPRPDRMAHYLPWPVGRYDDSAVLPAPKHHRLPVRILCVAKLGHARKNQDQLIEAIRSADLTSSIKLTLVGSVPEQSQADNVAHYRALKSLANESWIQFLEAQPFPQMADLYMTHDVCILPSHHEPLGSSPVEGMAYGVVPVISTECGSAGYIRDGFNGVHINMRSTASLRATLTRLVQDKALIPTLSKNALATVGNSLSEEIFIHRIEKLLQGERLLP